MIASIFFMVLVCLLFLLSLLGIINVCHPLVFLLLIFIAWFGMPALFFAFTSVEVGAFAYLFIFLTLLLYLSGGIVGNSMFKQSKGDDRSDAIRKTILCFEDRKLLGSILIVVAALVVLVPYEYSQQGFSLLVPFSKYPLQGEIIRGSVYSGAYIQTWTSSAIPILTQFSVLLSAYLLILKKKGGQSIKLSYIGIGLLPFVCVFAHGILFGARMLVVVCLFQFLAGYLALQAYFRQETKITLGFLNKMVVRGALFFFLFSLPLSLRRGHLVLIDDAFKIVSDFFGYLPGFSTWIQSCFDQDNCSRYVVDFGITSTNLFTVIADTIMHFGISFHFIICFLVGFGFCYSFQKVRAGSLVLLPFLMGFYSYFFFYQTRIIFEYDSVTAALLMFFGYLRVQGPWTLRIPRALRYKMADAK